MTVIDRFVEDYAVVEVDSRLMKLSKERIHPSCREGDVIEEKNGIYYPNKEKTEQLREVVIQRLKKFLADAEKEQ